VQRRRAAFSAVAPHVLNDLAYYVSLGAWLIGGCGLNGVDALDAALSVVVGVVYLIPIHRSAVWVVNEATF